jgi:hypothetical protein
MESALATEPLGWEKDPFWTQIARQDVKLLGNLNPKWQETMAHFVIIELIASQKHGIPFDDNIKPFFTVLFKFKACMNTQRGKNC